MQSRSKIDQLRLGQACEEWLSSRDSILGGIIASQSARWPTVPIEDPIWGLVRIVMAQQVSTSLACQIADQAKSAFPDIAMPIRTSTPTVENFRSWGMPERRSFCCATILERSIDIIARVESGETWEDELSGIKGIGPWTLATFRVMVLREPDILPLGDVGLERAFRNVYGTDASLEDVSEGWRPYRSVACWYLWRTLGNRQLG